MRKDVTLRRPGRSKVLVVGICLVGVFLAGIFLAACQQIELWMADSEGERLWLQHCARCHGRDGAGRPRRGGQHAEVHGPALRRSDRRSLAHRG